MKKKLMTLMMGTLLLLTACGQTREQFRIENVAGGGGAERSTRCGWCSGQDGGQG